MSRTQIQEQNKIEGIIVEKKRLGIKRDLTQILDTMRFELLRAWKSFILLFVVFFLVFLLNSILYQLQVLQGVDLPEDSIDYVGGYLNWLDILIIVSTATLGGAIIAEDFQKQTGNLLFPKVSKIHLLVGRAVSRYGLNAILIIFYYWLIAIDTNQQYGELPTNFIISMEWALLYTFMIFTFVILMSSISKSKSTTMIISILLLLMVFNIINSILMFTQTGIEPLFLLTYYGNIITASLDMPDPRWQKVSFGPPNEQNPVEFKQWITPSSSAALQGMLLFSLVFLIASYIIYI
ncbi:MAG: hypothetical protein ACFFCM_18180, partial [Promethearchaeota archaeon]